MDSDSEAARKATRSIMYADFEAALDATRANSILPPEGMYLHEDGGLTFHPPHLRPRIGPYLDIASRPLYTEVVNDTGTDSAPPDPQLEQKRAYLEGDQKSLEDLDDYKQGGYHPILIGDTLGRSGRYRVIHKLGHGGCSTVWLCVDSQPISRKYVAIKVHRSSFKRERLFDDKLALMDAYGQGFQNLAFKLHTFYIDGPNGTHICVVYPVYGPPISPSLWKYLACDPGVVLRDMAWQATVALKYLHSKGYGHGDFRPANILVELDKFDHLREDQLLARLGQPIKVPVQTETNGFVQATAPEYLVRAADIYGLSGYLTKTIRVIDFDEAFLLRSPPEDLGTPVNYLPPEALLDMEGAIGDTSDLWALGCTIFEIRQQMPLFERDNENEMLAEIVRLFGKLPDDMWNRWEVWDTYFDSQMRCISPDFYGDNPERSLEDCLDKPKIIEGPDGDGPVEMRLTLRPEQRAFADLLYQILQYNKMERLTAAELMNEDWFNFTEKNEDEEGNGEEDEAEDEDEDEDENEEEERRWGEEE